MDFCWKIGGEAGMGIMASGLSMCKAMMRLGFNVVGYPEYPSLVRGGENTFQVRISETGADSPLRKSNLCVFLNTPTAEFHKGQLNDGGAAIFDSSSTKAAESDFPACVLFDVPLSKIASDNGGDEIMRNTVALGASLAVMGMDTAALEEVMREAFAKKGEQVISQNIKILRAGHDYVISSCKAQLKKCTFKVSAPKAKGAKRMLISGNEAIALGAAAGGLKLFSVYPMTPSSTIMHYLAQKELDFGVVIKQTEDEIAAVQYAVGAEYAGVRAATGTSGGGFSLMAETLGLSGISETPVTIFLAQRPGPSTCLPTWTEQADLKFVLNASQGEFLRAIVAPGDMAEEFEWGWKTLNIAEKYQLPAILLTDKYLSESFFSTGRFDLSKVKIERGKIIRDALPALAPQARYKRYLLTVDGVSPRPIPGTENGEHVAGSYEHDETGYSTETFPTRKAMVDKRMSKIKGILKSEFAMPKIYGDKTADITLVCWGSQKGPAIEAAKMLKAEGVNANVLHFVFLFPLDTEKISALFSTLKKTVMVENNATGQFAGVLREYAGVGTDHVVLKYDGRQFFPEDIVQEVLKLKKGGWKEKTVRFAETFSLDYLQAKKVES
jgi:2-oxoglutarate/2-oxoacid ferredoxin oxidoreductase subunit alpha